MRIIYQEGLEFGLSFGEICCVINVFHNALTLLFSAPAKEGKTWRPSHLRERISNLVSRSSRLQVSPICELEDRGRRIGVGQPLNHPWTLLAQGHTKVSKAGDLNSESLYLNQFVLRIKLRR